MSFTDVEGANASALDLVSVTVNDAGSYGVGIANLPEHVLGGDPSAADSAERAPLVTVVEDGEGTHLDLEFVCAVVVVAVPVGFGGSLDLVSGTTLVDGVNAEIEVIPFIGAGLFACLRGVA